MTDAVKLPPMPECKSISIKDRADVPMYFEARRYCEYHRLPYEDLERVRQYLAAREWHTRIEPIRMQYVKLMSMLPPTIMSDGALKALQDMMNHEAEKLGLKVQP